MEVPEYQKDNVQKHPNVISTKAVHKLASKFTYYQMLSIKA